MRVAKQVRRDFSPFAKHVFKLASFFVELTNAAPEEAASPALGRFLFG